jgi:hypothetical protein
VPLCALGGNLFRAEWERGRGRARHTVMKRARGAAGLLTVLLLGACSGTPGPTPAPIPPVGIITGTVTPCRAGYPSVGTPQQPMIIVASQAGISKGSTSSDARGRYTLRLAPGHYVLQVDHELMAQAVLAANQTVHVDRIANC